MLDRAACGVFTFKSDQYCLCQKELRNRYCFEVSGKLPVINHKSRHATKYLFYFLVQNLKKEGLVLILRFTR